MKILIVRFSSFGDIVLTSGIIKIIRDNIKYIEIDVLTLDDYVDLWENVDNVYHISRKDSLRAFVQKIKELPEYDYIFDLQNNIRSLLVKIFVKSDKKVTYNKRSLRRRIYSNPHQRIKLYLFESNKERVFKIFLPKHTVKNYAQVILPSLGLKVPLEMEELRPYYKPSAEVKRNPKKIVIHPFASKKTKVWLYFRELASELLTLGYEVYIVGQGDYDGFPKGSVRVVTKTINELKSFIEDSALFISTDSGPMHMAVAYRLPLVAIFCSTCKELGFYPEFKNCVALSSKERCVPCGVHGLNSCPRRSDACRKTPVNMVLTSVLLQLKK